MATEARCLRLEGAERMFVEMAAGISKDIADQPELSRAEYFAGLADLLVRRPAMAVELCSIALLREHERMQNAGGAS
jgi:hypothetical protein